MPHGWVGLGVSIATYLGLFGMAYARTPEGSFLFEQKEGQFEHLLTTYLDIAKFILSLAAGGIVLIISSAAFSPNRKLPDAYASPLFILGASIIYGVVFMLALTWNYEGFKHKTSPYTRRKYARNQALGFSSLACFCLGYLWLIAAAVKG
jgi:lysylphosphatidylglycerol synthetase-like protein (DUF2156 family)